MTSARPSRARALLAGLLAAVLGLTLAPPGALGQDEPRIEARAEIQRTRAYVGDRVIYQITVSGSDAPQAPRVEAPPGITINALGGRPSQHTFGLTINGRVVEQSSSFIFQYEVVPQTEGTHTIGPATVAVDGREYTTNRVQLTAINPQDASAGYPLTVEIENDSLWVGQAVRARVTWLFGDNADAISFDASALPPSFTVLENRTPPSGATSREMRWIEVMGQNLIAAFDRTQLDATPVRRLTFELLLQPTAPGTFDLGPLSIVFDRSIPARGRIRSIAQSNTQRVTVRALPAEGRPGSFGGAIGVYTLSARSSSPSANVGDPIELVLQIEGAEPMPGITDGPDLSADPAFASAFRIASDGWDRVDSEIPGQRVFRTTLRPLRADVTQIPPVELPYFDVAAGQYRTARTEPIPLQVRAVREVTADDAVVAALPAAITRSPLSGTGPALWAADRGPALLRSDAFDLYERFTDPLLLAFLLAPPCLYALALAWRVSRARSDPARARRRRALARATSELTRSGPAPAARRLLADLLDREPASITAQDCDTLPLSPAQRTALRSLLEPEEATRYGAATPSAADTRRARQILRESFTVARAAV